MTKSRCYRHSNIVPTFDKAKGLVRGRPELSSFSRAFMAYAGKVDISL